jgi:hypothetical protein
MLIGMSLVIRRKLTDAPLVNAAPIEPEPETAGFGA